MTAPDAAFVLPVGTVTFLLTDVAGSTRMWEAEADDVMRSAVVRHYEILSEAVDAHGGVRPQEQGEGDSIVAAFARPSDALAAATAAQVALAAEPWPTSQPMLVRMALHTGEAQLRDDANYVGQAIIRTARLRAIGHGGQILVSGATRDLAVDQVGSQFELRSLGEHRLRDLGRPEHVWQLIVAGGQTDFDELVSLDTVPNTLPVSLSPFIGREREIQELAELVLAERLVTATGTGGAGKTRLAQQVGAELVDRFPAGVWWVELAALDGDGVEPAVRSQFGVGAGARTPLPEAVRRKLDDQPCLLIVDNCEHVTDRIAPLLDELLRTAPSLHVLATSRVMLDLPGEQAWRVPALALPDVGTSIPLDALCQYDAVRLFCDRARRARPNFELTTATGAAVAEICHRLGGIPLSIELAAARVRMLDPHRILEGLDDAFRLLSGGSKALMPRQQTLDASIAWSHDLLNPPEQALLRRLSVFVDGWSLDAAEAVCPDPDEGSDLDAYAVFDALERLVDHSLVHTTDTPAGLRFAMLETVRQYASRQLALQPAEEAAAKQRHSEHFTGWAIDRRDEILDGAREALLHTVTAERSNILAAVDQAIGRGDGTRALHALVALVPILEVPAWVPMVTVLTRLLDRLDVLVEDEDRWRLLLVRQRTRALAGDLLGEFETIDLMIRSAASADQPIGVALGRFMLLAMMASGGASVVDEAVEALDELEAIAPLWARTERLRLAFGGAFLGRLDACEQAMEQVRRGPAVPMQRAMVDLVDAMMALVRGDAAAARPALESVNRSPFLAPGTKVVADAFLAIAGADLGTDVTVELERRYRRICEVDGNELAGMTADGLLGIHHLLADDTGLANEAVRRANDIGLQLGLPGAWTNERYVLVAAGHNDYHDVLHLPGGVTVDTSNSRARAEQHLQAGELAAALDEAHESLDLALQHQVGRGVLLTLETISRILTGAGRHAEATRLRGACHAFRSDTTTVPYPCLQRLLDESAAKSRSAMGDDDYEGAIAEGSSLSLTAAADYARRQRASHTTAKVGWDALTPTEARVAELVAEGLTNAQVATKLLMGGETVKTHLGRVFDKIGVANRKELIVAASRRAAERHR